MLDLNLPHKEGNFKLDQMFGTKPTQAGIKDQRMPGSARMLLLLSGTSFLRC